MIKQRRSSYCRICSLGLINFDTKFGGNLCYEISFCGSKYWTDGQIDQPSSQSTARRSKREIRGRERTMRSSPTVGVILDCAVHWNMNWTGLCGIASLSFSHQRSKLRTFQISVSLLNIFILCLSLWLASLLNTLWTQQSLFSASVFTVCTLCCIMGRLFCNGNSSNF